MKFKINKIRLSYKLYAGFIPLFIFLILFGFYFISFIKKIESSFKYISNTYDELRIALKLDQTNAFLADTAKAFILTRDPELEKQYDSASGVFDDLFTQL
ncbi:hypothetical protein A2643_02030 [Candidatus Nomurabacteria bacterium RIFCSPHIGHO2_01_FULL_39_220]|uniref:Chemotaxis methyl-accepting receptor HlyB-like 4HB MCP domain-containing protein n=1 Tax=Candidatus Nomurabacteria bacterium RIFCSPLOWO2_02_FULL_40_67 TaxID=1801787 RepID=A0A1F6Y6Z2_9BACT|nr:MAG: hypothetical protein UU01_C0007G0037 [Parcubacteria group bacterium GW2011_GWA2_40_37]KKS10897.1 MAG: hypothetical protein UU66_C0037G0001 [Parcubacteria group bacterium GW2011_GWB1_41_5]OGI62919.1 MAG: hypothetical protein A2W12_02570 [Candidatus Nomurabacteria bacterium RBG_16_40_11]OGI70493.1 MAG: hypothetical protein A2643_02030 [Candidatus Nomurabacteria bacterium RIFCSPHIGHO2_01_FULL_39_220]OGI71894.1 MAG: hypothetical protein A2W56_00250 [Candidatus Nomurabacteria bacterium RIFCS